MFEATAESLTAPSTPRTATPTAIPPESRKIFRRIAREPDCRQANDQVYFAPLLHDVGEIGIRTTSSTRSRAADE
jgi:hypothetical protein